jgi:hypothetical protein
VAFGERRRIRTFDRLLRRQVLYPAELCVHNFNFLTFCLEGSCLICNDINKKTTLSSGFECERRRIRTFDRLLRRQVLYPAELCVHYLIVVGVAGFEPAASCSQSRRDNRATLHPEAKFKRRDRDSNPGDGYPSTD